MNKIFTVLWKFICIDFNPFTYYNLKLTNSAVLFTSIRKMESKKEDLKLLNKRLNAVDNEVKKLMKEIASIRGAMQNISCQKANIAAVTKRQYSTEAKDIIDSIDLKDFEEDFEEVQPSKRIKQDQCKEEFIYQDDHAIVYTDGACENNGRKGAKAGIGVWFGPNHPLNISAPVVGKATNNTAEIQACVRAIDVAYENGVRKLCIRTDSQFVINSMTSWIKKWKKNNWTLTSGGEVKNKEEFMKLDTYCNKLTSIKWEHVAGHRGVVGNEAADQLARDGALLYVS